jgi:hypothetical protein
MNTLYTLEQLTTDTRHLFASDDTLKVIHESVNQQEIIDNCKTIYSVVHFKRTEPFFTQSPEIIIESYQLQKEHSLYAVLKNDSILFICVTTDKPVVESKKVIENLANSDAIEKIKSILIQQVQLNHDAYVSTIRQEAEEAAHETLVLELIERGVL